MCVHGDSGNEGYDGALPWKRTSDMGKTNGHSGITYFETVDIPRLLRARRSSKAQERDPGVKSAPVMVCVIKLQ